MNTTEKQTEKSVAYPKSSQKAIAAKRKKKKKPNRQENPCKTSKKKRKKTSNNKTWEKRYTFLKRTEKWKSNGKVSVLKGSIYLLHICTYWFLHMEQNKIKCCISRDLIKVAVLTDIKRI